MVTASAPAKVHFIGEHSVVYGEPAIITAIGRRTTVRAEQSDRVTYHDTRFPAPARTYALEDVRATTIRTLGLRAAGKEQGNFSELLASVRADGYAGYRKSVVGIALERLGIAGGVSVEVGGNVLVSSGMGSSSSLAVALTKAIAEAYGKKPSLEEVNGIAYEMEKIMHGTPSGGDNTACCYGGMIWFRKGQPNEIRPLQNEVPHALENFVLVSLAREGNAGELIQVVRNHPETFRTPRIRQLGEATQEMLSALKTKNYPKIRELINLAQKNLAELGVSTPATDRIAKAVRDIGGGAKLCGAGGGGIMLTQHEDKKLLLKTITDLGHKPIEADLGVEGVRME